MFLGTNTAMKNKDTILNEARIAGAALGQYAANKWPILTIEERKGLIHKAAIGYAVRLPFGSTEGDIKLEIATQDAFEDAALKTFTKELAR